MQLIIKSCIKMAFMNQSFLFKRFYLFLDRREGKEKERERNINVWLPLVRPPTRYLALNPGMCPDWESQVTLICRPALSPLSHTSQGINLH